MDSKIEELRKIAEKYDIGLSHFLVETEIKQNSIENFGRFSLSKIPKGKDIAIIGGLIVEERDGMIAMPIGAGLYLNQIHMLYRASINHSCDPNCRVIGFNKIISLKEINKNEEITIDYGTISVGSGNIIFDNCNCKKENCRSTIRTNDYLFLDNLAAYAQYQKEKISDDKVIRSIHKQK